MYVRSWQHQSRSSVAQLLRQDRSGSDSGFVTSLAGSLPKVQFRDVLTGGDRFGDGAAGGSWWGHSLVNWMGVTYLPPTYFMSFGPFCMFSRTSHDVLGGESAWHLQLSHPAGSLKSHTSLVSSLIISVPLNSLVRLKLWSKMAKGNHGKSCPVCSGTLSIKGDTPGISPAREALRCQGVS